MRAATLIRIIRTNVRVRDVETLRGVRQLIDRAPVAQGRSRALVRLIVRDLVRYASNGVTAIEGDTLARAHLAAAWVARAQDATGDGGFPHGYFPFRAANGWRESYPETTGYTIPTLLAYAAVAGAPEFCARAIRMARFVARCQLPSGAIPGGVSRARESQVAVAFNTGMALLGFLAIYEHTGDEHFEQCARRAADFLVGDIDADGHFRSHGPFVYPAQVKTYTCLCAWPLYWAGQQFDHGPYRTGAMRVGDAALRQQQENGWFANNCLSMRVDAPLLHTIGYTLQGLLELGIISGRAQYAAAAMRGVEPLLPHCERGFLHGRWFADWQPGSLSSCLTGSAQVAVVCYRLAAHTGDSRYRRAADAVLDYLKALQPTGAAAVADPEIVGGIGGSFPLVGSYMANGFPGWATKFYLDALLCQHACAVHGHARPAHHPTAAAAPGAQAPRGLDLEAV